jgi:hypothetical protein
LIGGFLDLTGQFFHLGAIVVTRGGEVPGQQMPQGVHRDVRFAPCFAFMPVIAARSPLSGVDCSVRLSKMAAVGCSARPWASRNSAHRSWTMAANTPALINRWVYWYTVNQGGRSLGIIRQGAPARTIHRKALKTSRKG